MTSAAPSRNAHGRRLRVLPGTRLGRWAAWLFVAALALGASFPVTTPLLERLTGADMHDTPFVTPLPYAAIVAGVSGVMSVAALFRERAVLLFVPAVLGTPTGLFLVMQFFVDGG